MKYQFLTVNTGHLSRHDTDVDLRPEVVPMVRALVAPGDLFILADFEKTMFSVWALGKLDAAHKS